MLDYANMGPGIWIPVCRIYMYIYIYTRILYVLGICSSYLDPSSHKKNVLGYPRVFVVGSMCRGSWFVDRLVRRDAER